MTNDQDANTTRPVLPVVVIGAGGHARVLLSLLALQERATLALLDDNASLRGQTIGQPGITVAGGLDRVTQFSPDQVELVNAIGSAHRPTTRQAIYDKLTAEGYRFATLIHPKAIIAPEATIQAGAQVMAGAVIQPGASIHANCLINTKASIDHDTTIGEHTHIAPGVTVCGDVKVGTGCHIGAGATIVQGVSIGDGAVVGAGATVISDVPENLLVIGTPAKPC